jgi:hypothetical protein
VATGTTSRPFAFFTAHAPPARSARRLTLDDVELTAAGGEATEAHIRASDRLVAEVAARLWGSPESDRLVLLHGALGMLTADLDVERNTAERLVLDLRRDLCFRAFSHVRQRFPDVVNPRGLVLDPIEFWLDGYDVNENFMGGGLDFASNRQLHFDIVEPLGSNLYGPNLNMAGGLPVFADAAAYCRDSGVRIRDVLDTIPGTRNLTLAPQHYAPLVAGYAVAFDVDMTDDTPFTVFVNRVEEAGLVHGATDPHLVDPAAPRRRPICHYAFDNVTDDAAADWYAALGQTGRRSAGDTSRPKPVVPVGRRIDAEIPVLRVA